MKKFALKTLTLIVACMLASTSLVACTDKTDSSSDASTGDSSTTEGSSESEQSDTPKGYIKKGFNEETGKYDPPITLTTVRRSMESFSLTYDEVNKSTEDNVWITEIFDRYGIKIEYDWVVDQTQYDTKYNLMLSSGDIPDFINVTPWNVNKLLNADILADLTQAYENAPPIVKKYTSLCDEIAFNAVTKDGKLYGIPHSPVGAQASLSIFVRKDWLKNVGISEPKTMDDIMEISKKFALDDPDKNGKDDTMGMYVSPDPINNGSMKGFFNGYHAYPGAYIEDENGQLTAGTILPEMKTALAALQDLYKQGAVSKEFGTMDYNKITETFTNGKIGLWYGTYPEPLVYIQNNINNEPEADWGCYPIVSVDEKPALSQSSGGISGYQVVSKDCENPDGVLFLMDLFGDIFLDNKDFDVYSKFVNDPKGQEIWHLSPLDMDDNIARGIKVSNDFVKYFNGEIKIDEVAPETRGVAERAQSYKDGDVANWKWDAIYKENGPLQTIKGYLENDQMIYNKMQGTFSDQTSQRSEAANKILQEAVTNIIKGQDVNSFDAAVEQWKSLGGNDIIKEANEWYTQYK